MSPGRETLFAASLAALAFVVAVVCYAAFPPSLSDPPARLLLRAPAGEVLFGHELHAEEYGIGCSTCHHHQQEGSCDACHPAKIGEEDLPDTCFDCHDEDDVEGVELEERADAFHAQCVGCHDDYGVAEGECDECHFSVRW